ncbi:complement factor H-like [Lates japonicus]
MCARYFGFILLLWFPGVLHAQSTAQSCRAPRLAHGYFLPDLETYPHETKLTYACDDGLKPVVEGWWATSTCQNGKWVHNPQCIDEKACFPPTIPNAKYTENSNGWYEEGDTIRTTCDEGYEHKDRNAIARCTNGTWSSLPICEKHRHTCGEPPKIPHAVIIHQRYREVFAVDSEVQYVCEDGYTMEGGHTKKSIFCMSGTWNEGPTCSLGTGAGTGHGGSPEVGTGGGHTQPGREDSRPDAGHGGSPDLGTGGGHTTSTGRGTQPGREDSRPDAGHGGSPEVGTGSSTTSGSRTVYATINTCGKHPVVPNAVVVQVERMYLKYKCNSFYKQEGLDTVACYGDGTWSALPVCKEAFCVMKPGPYVYGLDISAAVYLKEGEQKVPCRWPDYSVAVLCTNGRITYTHCCSSYDHGRGVCRYITTRE